MNKKKQYFINGLILIIIALLAVTVVPYCADKYRVVIEKTSYSEFEFFVLCAASLFYLFSPKYYKLQVLSIIFAILCYFLFVKIFPLI